MRNLLAIFLTLCYSCCFAQKGLYLSASAGLGGSNYNQKSTYIIPGDKKSILSPAYEVKLGYQLGNTRISAGLTYFKTGYCRKDYTTIFAPPLLTPYSTDVYSIFSHLAIPVRMGSAIYLSKRLNLHPQIGADFAYNLGEKVIYKNEQNTFKYIITNTEFYNTYQSFSLFAAGEVHLEYKAGRIDIFAGPSAKYMVGEFLKKSPHISQRGYAVYFTTGLQFFLNNNAAK